MAQAPNVFTTPKGIAAYPWLSKPDTKFSEEGDYKVNLILTKEDAAPIIEQINEVFAENVKAEIKKNKGKEVKTSNPPYMNELDADGNPTGNIIFKFKSKAAYKPAIFDAQGTVMLESNIWAGSEIKVNGSIGPYFTPLIGAGVALRLRAVQVIQYVEGGTGPERFGFEAVDGGFVQEAPQVEPTFEEPTPAPAPTPAPDVIPEPTVRASAADEEPAGTDINDIMNKWSTKT
mgnify:FL=1|tara:strand:+ start:2159 stop:2854 length:696 start_codon:yes stop_codon:yes gene_type:complete